MAFLKVTDLRFSLFDCSDQAIREHLVQIQLSPDYPEREPSCNAVSPSCDNFCQITQLFG